jgi:hypothetical protein
MRESSYKRVQIIEGWNLKPYLQMMITTMTRMMMMILTMMTTLLKYLTL